MSTKIHSAVFLLVFGFCHSYSYGATEDNYPVWSSNPANKQRLSDSELNLLLPALNATEDPYLILGLDRKIATAVQARTVQVLYINALEHVKTMAIEHVRTTGFPDWSYAHINAAIERVRSAFLEILKIDGRRLLGVTKDASGHYHFVDELAEWDLKLVPPSPQNPQGDVQIRHRAISVGRRMRTEITNGLYSQLLASYGGNVEAVHRFLMNMQSRSIKQALSILKEKVGGQFISKEVQEFERDLKEGPASADKISVFTLSLVARGIDVMPLLSRMQFVLAQLKRWQEDSDARIQEYSNALSYWEKNPGDLENTPTDSGHCNFALTTGIVENN